MPNRFAWITATVVLTAIGVVTAPAEYVSPKVSPRKVHDRPAAPADEGPEGPAESKIIDLTYIAAPDGVTLPVSDAGDVFLPNERVRLLVVPQADRGTYDLSTEPPVSKVPRDTTPSAPATRSVPKGDIGDALAELAGEVRGLQLIVVADAAVRWRPRLDGILSAAAGAELPVVFFAVAPADGSPGLRTFKYLTYETAGGGRTAVLPGRDDDPLDGGVLRVDVVAGRPAFRFAHEEKETAAGLVELMGAYHDDYLQSAEGGPSYDDDGRAWTVRPAASAPWGAVIDALGAIRDAGVARAGIEWPE